MNRLLTPFLLLLAAASLAQDVKIQWARNTKKTEG